MTVSDREARLQALRRRAEAVLAQGDAFQQPSPTGPPEQLAVLLEELRIYQAELEVQNAELTDAQQLSEHARARYETLFESLPLPGLVVDRRGLIREVNQAAVNLFGFRTRGLLAQHSVYRLMPQEEGSVLSEWLKSDVPTAHGRMMLEMRSAKGERLQMELHLAPLPVQFHLDPHFLLLLLDRSAEAEHDRERRIFEAMMDNASAMIFAFDREGRCLLANRPMRQLMGGGGATVLGHTREGWLSPEDVAQHQHNDALVLASGKALVFEEQVRAGGGALRHYVSHKFPLRNQQDEVFAVGGICTDVTEAREKEARLELAMQVFSRGSEGIVITDQHNRIISINQAFERITGYSEKEAIGRDPKLLASGRHDRAFYEAMWADIESRGCWEGEIWNRRRNGEVYPQWLNASRVSTDNLQTTHYIGVFSDISQRKLAEEEVERLAFYDSLTGVPNRYLLRDRVEQAIRVAQRETRSFAMAFIDLDHFKEVNDVFGHETGDGLLCGVVKRIHGNIREQDTLSRIGGDEFVLVLQDLGEQEAGNRLQTILARMLEPFEVGEHTLNLSASMGVAIYPADGEDFTSLLKNADIAMYQAKAAGRNQLCYFNPRMAQVARERMQIETALRDAIGRGELALHYQPQLSLGDGRLVGVEALLRWHHPSLGWVSPNDFIPVAEESRLIVTIGDWVIDEALRQLALWRAAGRDGFVVAVNVSARQLWMSDFVDGLAAKLAAFGVPGDALELEFTERVAMESPERGLPLMRALKKLGVRLSIDDFGTGYSSLAYLRWMPVDVLKIDQAFVHDIGLNQDDESICQSIIELARSLGIRTVAEGVETPEHARFLRQHHCAVGQGYLFAHPMTANTFESWIDTSAQRAWPWAVEEHD